MQLQVLDITGEIEKFSKFGSITRKWGSETELCSEKMAGKLVDSNYVRFVIFSAACIGTRRFYPIFGAFSAFFEKFVVRGEKFTVR